MQALDTNLLLRLIVADDPAQARKVKDLLDRHAADDAAFWIADIVLVECVWALDRIYGHSRADIVVALRALASNATLRLESEAQVSEAISSYEDGPADFADALLVSKAVRAGCDSVRTFDKKMRTLPCVRLL
ncbi:MAG: type II toxin-antitoxin system VapC family toxin [Variovorax sp.]